MHLERRRIVADVDRVIVIAARRRARGAQHAVNEFYRLVHPVEPLADAPAEIDAEGGVLRLEPGRAKAQDRATNREVVECRHELDHEPRVAEGVGAHEQAKGRVGRHLAPAREHHVALEDRALG